MKKIIKITFLLSLIVMSAIAEVEYGYLLGTEQSVILDEGETFTLLANNFNMNTSDGDLKIAFAPDYEFSIKIDFFRNKSYGTIGDNDINVVTPNYGTIAGPCKVQLNKASLYCSYKIARHEVTISPMNIIALPADNNGDVDVLVETSTDLITWTPAYSGSAGTSNNAAFFRTRLITQ